MVVPEGAAAGQAHLQPPAGPLNLFTYNPSAPMHGGMPGGANHGQPSTHTQWGRRHQAPSIRVLPAGPALQHCTHTYFLAHALTLLRPDLFAVGVRASGAGSGGCDRQRSRCPGSAGREGRLPQLQRKAVTS